jgi:hypothetical protein
MGQMEMVAWTAALIRTDKPALDVKREAEQKENNI